MQLVRLTSHQNNVMINNTPLQYLNMYQFFSRKFYQSTSRQVHPRDLIDVKAARLICADKSTRSIHSTWIERNTLLHITIRTSIKHYAHYIYISLSSPITHLNASGLFPFDAANLFAFRSSETTYML